MNFPTQKAQKLMLAAGGRKTAPNDTEPFCFVFCYDAFTDGTDDGVASTSPQAKLA